MSHSPEQPTSRLDKRVVVAWLVVAVIVAALASVWSVRETPIVEPTPVILPTGA